MRIFHALSAGHEHLVKFGTTTLLWDFCLNDFLQAIAFSRNLGKAERDLDYLIECPTFKQERID